MAEHSQEADQGWVTGAGEELHLPTALLAWAWTSSGEEQRAEGTRVDGWQQRL